MLNVVNLGAGVQSTTMVLMAAAGELTPMPDCAIFADTGSEPVAVYKHLEWLRSGVLPFPVNVIGDLDLGEEILKATRGESKRGSHARPPFFVKNPDGSRGVLKRQCTGKFKIAPIEKEIRRMLGLKYRQHWPKQHVVTQWIGISRDEATRMTSNPRPAIHLRYPLIERHMSRSACLHWLSERGYQRPPKSACTFCPYRSDDFWLHLRETDQAGWAQAIAIDEAIRNGMNGAGISGALYLHDSLKPLAEVDLVAPRERPQGNLFENECKGGCGV